MPLYRRLPKRGFTNFNIKKKKYVAIINLSKIQKIIDQEDYVYAEVELLGSLNEKPYSSEDKILELNPLLNLLFQNLQ